MNHLFKAIACILSATALLVLSHSTLYGQQKDPFFEVYQSYSLSSVSASFGTGISIFNGDLHSTLNGKAQNNFMNFFGSGSIYYRTTSFFSIRATGSLYKIYTKPGNGIRNEEDRERSPVASSNAEAFMAGQFDLVSRSLIDSEQKNWNIYLLAGAGFTWFEPRNAETQELLRPQSEKEAIQEGRFLYANPMPIIPFGAGFSYYLSNNQAFEFEVVYRHSLSDWMDDTYGRGDSKYADNDGYFLVGLQYKYTFLSAGKKMGGFNYKRYRRKKGRR